MVYGDAAAVMTMMIEAVRGLAQKPRLTCRDACED